MNKDNKQQKSEGQTFQLPRSIAAIVKVVETAILSAKNTGVEVRQSLREMLLTWALPQARSGRHGDHFLQLDAIRTSARMSRENLSTMRSCADYLEYLIAMGVRVAA